MTETKTQDKPKAANIEKKKDAPLSTAVMPEGMGGLNNAEQDDFSIDRLTVIQGTSKEIELHGEHERGTWVYCSTGVALDIKDLPFVPIMGYNEWIKYAAGGTGAGIEYRTQNLADVNPDDLIWGTGKNDKGFAAVKHSNWVVLFEGHDMPVIISFKKTSLKSGQALSSMETARKVAAKRRGENPTPGLYCLDVRDKSFSEGSALIASPRPAGNPSEELLAFAVEWYNILGDSHNVASKDKGADEDIPI